MSGESSRKQPRATCADILHVPPHLVAEIIDGTLITSPRPASPHARTSSRLGSSLGPPFDVGAGGPGGWVILDEPELHLGPEPDVLVPDLAGWRRERMPELPDAAAFTLAPDWVCEVISPSTEAHDRAGKMPIYAREGVAHLWLVDPLLQTLEVFQLEGRAWMLVSVHRGASRVAAPPFAALELDLALLWAR
jgi:Uma2 family endonuclease